MGDNVYRDLKSACERFFGEQDAEDFVLNEDNVDQIPAGETVYDLTDKNAKQITELLIAVVNQDEWQDIDQQRPSYFVVQPNDPFKIIFKLESNPTPKQPGNGKVSMRTNNNKFIGYTYEHLYPVIKDKDPEKFFKQLKDSFKNCNKIIGAMNGVADSFMLLLFEIARRRVKQKRAYHKRKQAYDELPIASFIACAIELHEPKGFNFVDIFNPESEFHCFKGEPEDRKHNLMKLITLYVNEFGEDHPDWYWDSQLKNVFQNTEDGEGDEIDEMTSKFNQLKP